MNIRAIMLLSAALLASCAHSRVETHGHFAPDVTVATVRVADYEDTISAVGRVGGINGNQTNVSFPVPGVVSDVYVHIGDHVSPGEILAALNGRGYRLAAAQAHADVSVARANARAASIDRYTTRIGVDEAAVQRESSLYALGVAARKEVISARAQLAQDSADAAVARAQSSANVAAVESARMHAALADRDMDNSILRAPENGVVSEITRRPGESVDAGVPVVTVSSAQTPDITLSVPASGLASIHAGDAVRLEVLGTSVRSQGIVAGVSHVIDPTTQTGTVTVQGLPLDVPIGSMVQAKIVVARLRGLLVPESAIVQDPETGNAVIFVATRDKGGNTNFRQHIITIQHHNGEYALVVSGLHAGQHIASRGGFTLLAPSDSGGD